MCCTYSSKHRKMRIHSVSMSDCGKEIMGRPVGRLVVAKQPSRGLPPGPIGHIRIQLWTSYTLCNGRKLGF